MPAFGRLHAPDERDRHFPMSAVLRAAAPLRTERFYRTGPVLNQGDLPQCVRFAWWQFLRSAPIMTAIELSGDFYTECQRADEWPGEDYDGTSVRAGAKVLQDKGRLASYVWSWSAAEMRDWILRSHGTVVMGTNWYSGMNTPSPRTGFVPLTGALVGGHAYLCIGYSERRGAFRFINSWGATWGQRGRFWTKGEDVDRLLKEDGEACSAVEQKLVTLPVADGAS